MIHVGWEHYRRGYRLLRPPPAKADRQRMVEVPAPHDQAPGACSARYALCLGAAVLAGEGFSCRPAKLTRRVSFRCPEALTGLPGLSERVSAGLVAIRDSTSPVPVVPSTGAVVGVYLTAQAAEALALLGGNRSHWLRAAAAKGM